MELKNNKLQALTGYCIVEAVDFDEQKTASGIVLVTKQKQNIFVQGRVHSAGKDRIFESKKITDAPVKEGDVVLFKKYESEKIMFDDIFLYKVPYTRVRMILDGDETVN